MKIKDIYVLGLTGSIGMGKSVASQMFSKLGVPVFDSDAEVHKLFETDQGVISNIKTLFPEVVNEGKISRPKLGELVFNDQIKLKQLEEIIHPIIRQKQKRFIRSAKFRNKKLVVLDIPLLFEKGGQKNCDGVVLVTAPKEVQKKRVLGRPNMTEERFENILKSQLPDSIKRKKADFIIPSNFGFEYSFNEISSLVRMLKRKINLKSKRIVASA